MKNIVVVGAGTMGNGIAHLFAQKGFTVTLTDQSESALQQAEKTIAKNLQRLCDKEKIDASLMQQTLDRLTYTTTAVNAYNSADLVVEAVSENLAVKKAVFEQLSLKTPANCILASNTSSLSIDTLAVFTDRPRLVIGMHFFNPVPMMPLVEIIQGTETTTATVETILALTAILGKTGVLAKDAPGFVANRILLPMINEAITTLGEGVSDVQGIDTVMKLGMGHPMGPLQLADFIGLDVCLSILEVLDNGLNKPHYKPHAILRELVAAGHLGVKSGRGFYDYTQDPKNPTVAYKN
jgi:3-hydroxybutyryl-CoA dehydrogenase